MESYTNEEFEFKERPLAGKVILVAGGTGGLGGTTVALLMKEGAIPVVGYKQNQERAGFLKQRLEDRYKPSLHLVAGDISDDQTRTKYIQVASKY